MQPPKIWLEIGPHLSLWISRAAPAKTVKLYLAMKNPLWTLPLFGVPKICSIAKVKIHLPMIKVIAPLCCDPVIETDTLQVLDYFRNLNWQKTVGRPKAYIHPLSTWSELKNTRGTTLIKLIPKKGTGDIALLTVSTSMGCSFPRHDHKNPRKKKPNTMFSSCQKKKRHINLGRDSLNTLKPWIFGG